MRDPQIIEKILKKMAKPMFKSPFDDFKLKISQKYGLNELTVIFYVPAQKEYEWNDKIYKTHTKEQESEARSLAIDLTMSVNRLFGLKIVLSEVILM